MIGTIVNIKVILETLTRVDLPQIHDIDHMKPKKWWLTVWHVTEIDKLCISPGKIAAMDCLSAKPSYKQFLTNCCKL